MEIRRSYDRLISTMGFPILIRRHRYIESGLWFTEAYTCITCPVCVDIYAMAIARANVTYQVCYLYKFGKPSVICHKYYILGKNISLYIYICIYINAPSKILHIIGLLSWMLTVPAVMLPIAAFSAIRTAIFNLYEYSLNVFGVIRCMMSTSLVQKKYVWMFSHSPCHGYSIVMKTHATTRFSPAKHLDIYGIVWVINDWCW